MRRLEKKVQELKCNIKINLTDASSSSKSEKFLKEIERDHGCDAAMEVKKIVGSEEKTKPLAFINQKEDENTWRNARKNLLTASTFNSVISKRNNTLCNNTVEDILYPRDISNLPAVQWGRDNEKSVVNMVRETTQLKIYDKLGIFQLASHPHIAATPDGLIFDSSRELGDQWGVLEIKCPYKNKERAADDSIEDYIGKKGVKETHSYYRQITGQMACVGVKWGLLAVWSPSMLRTHVVEFKEGLWSQWLERLDIFYENALAPEIVDGRIPRGQSIRQWCFNDGYVFNV